MRPENDTLKARLMDEQDMNRTLDRMARQIIEELDPNEENSARLAIVGMQTRGVYLAQRLQKKILEIENIDLKVGILDATLYRDDYRRRRTHPEVRVTDIPFDVDSLDIVLVDDVLYTGRTARAALDALMDLGRPASVTFLVMIDRGYRELPVSADIVGRYVPTTAGEEVRVRLRELDEEDAVWLVEPNDAQEYILRQT